MTKDIEYLKINGKEVPLVEPAEVITTIKRDGKSIEKDVQF